MARIGMGLVALAATCLLASPAVVADDTPAAPTAQQAVASPLKAAKANRLIVAARKDFDAAQATAPGERAALLETVLSELRSIIDSYPATDSAKLLAGGSEIAGLSIPGLEDALAAETAGPATAGAPPEALRLIAECDRLAADPDDPNRKSRGVWSIRMDVDAAVAACARALIAAPDEPRLTYQHGRALDAAGRKEQAVTEFRKAAEGNYPIAATELARRYLEGDGVTKDEIAGLLDLKKSADAGEATAMATLGQLLMNGKLLSQNVDRAIALYRGSAASGNPTGMLRLGRAYLNGMGVFQDANSALHWLKKAAALGSPEAAYSIATMLRDGVGMPADLAEAVRMMKAEAETGNAAAQNAFATMVYYGYGVDKDESAAIAWYEKAASGGEAIAHRILVGFYAEGGKVSKDPARAADHAMEAIRLGNAATIVYLESRAQRLGSAVVAAIQTKLKAEGLFNAEATGTFDDATKAALTTLLKRARAS